MGNVFTTGINRLCDMECGSPKLLASSNKRKTEVIPPELKVIVDQYLALLRNIQEAKENKSYEEKNYIQDFQTLINEYKNLIKEGQDIKIMKGALSGLFHLYKVMGDMPGLKNYLDNLLSTGNLNSYSPYIKRYLIWNNVDNKDYDGSLKTADEVFSLANSDEDLQAEMLYEKGLIYRYYLNDYDRAKEMYASIINDYPASPLTVFAENELGIKPDYSFKNAVNAQKQNANISDNELHNYPNPFNPTTTISFNLKQKDYVTLIVYDILGKEVARLVDGLQTEGEHSVSFDGSNLASGMYIYSLKGTNFNISKKMLLLK